MKARVINVSFCFVFSQTQILKREFLKRPWETFFKLDGRGRKQMAATEEAWNPGSKIEVQLGTNWLYKSYDKPASATFKTVLL